MILTGIGDEAGNSLSSQIQATKELGWKDIEARNVEIPGFPKANLHDLPEPAFDLAVEMFQSSGIRVPCFGSTIMNWAKTVADPFDLTLDEVSRTIPRMQRLGARYVRIMSFKPEDEADRIPLVVVERVREVTRRFLDAGLQPVHENCMNYGGMSPRHALELLDQVPGLKWVFDTANPVFNPDRTKPKPWPRQDPWEFWLAVRDQVVHLHVKDARWSHEKQSANYTWPGEGDGRVRDILRDALARGYDGAISIEPHMVVVFHGEHGAEADENAQRANYVEYGHRLERLLAEIRNTPA
jgi:sugar phosphate isomerase/epimerase